ncbi:MAG: hypothetical protein HY243_03750 [Proteobacteria bacterium]|nr:hypothetical protein [Pseudomonadota bacterium]
MSHSIALRAFRFIYVAFIVFLSAKTFLAAGTMAHAGHVAHGGMEHVPTTVFLTFLAGTEIAAALLFLWERVEIAAGAALIAVYAVATAVDVSLGQLPLHLAFYAAVTIYILYANRRLTVEAGPMLA